jgi:hypothetical protein
MSQIVVNEQVSAAFRQLREPTSITDSKGHVLGVFTPRPADEAVFDLDEAERISKEEVGRGRPLKEFWADVGAGRPIA